MSSKTSKAASVTPPVAEHQIVLGGNTTAQRVKIPGAYKGYVKVQANGVNVGVLFGDASVAADITATSTIDGSFEVTDFGTGACDYIGDGDKEHYDLANLASELLVGGDLYVSLDCDATAGTIRLVHNSGPRSL